MSALTFLTCRWQAAEDVTVRVARGVRQSAASGASLPRSPALSSGGSLEPTPLPGGSGRRSGT